MRLSSVFAALFAPALVLAQPAPSLVVHNARVFTADADAPWAEAVASDGETIIAVGTNADIEPYIGEGTEVIATPGSMLVPGMIDTHVHLASLASDSADMSAIYRRRRAETPSIAVEIARLIASGERQPSEIAVLVKKHDKATRIEAELRELGLL